MCEKYLLMDNVELAKEQHAELMMKIAEVASGLKALFIVPILLLYMVGVDLAVCADKINVAIWATMNVMIAAPLVGMGFALLFKRK